jgi:hypothetical protein
MKSKVFGLFFALTIATLLLSIASIPSVNAQQETDINIEILASVGGTTNPAPGMYAFPEGETYTITAIASEGFVFDHWLMTGDMSPHIPGEPPAEILMLHDNPLVGDCGYGYTYQIQAVFMPVSAAALPSVPVLYVVAIAIVVGILSAVGAYMVGKKRK